MEEINYDVEAIVKKINFAKAEKLIGEDFDLEKVDFEYLVQELELERVLRESLLEAETIVSDDELEKFISEVNFAKLIEHIVTHSKDFKDFSAAGETFESLSVDEMMVLQGAGDTNGEFTPTPTIIASSGACASVASAISGAVGSWLRC